MSVRGSSALHNAAAEGHEAVVAKLLADPLLELGARDEQGKTALHLAIWRGHERVVAQLLADIRTDVNASDSRGFTALHLAANRGRDTLVLRLLADSRTAINARDKEGRTALQIAVAAGKDKVAGLLLARDSSGVDGRAILHLAILTGNDELVSQLLAGRPASEIRNWVRSDGYEWSGLQLAVSYGNEKVATHLLTLIPELVDVLSPQGHNALQIAACFGAEKLMDMLLAMKPEWASCVDQSGNTLLHLAADSSPPLSPQALTKLWELSPPEAVRAVNEDGDTPFAIAVRNRDDFAMSLLQRKLSVDEILLASEAVHPEAVRRLRPALEAECACLLELLHRDVIGTVYEYLGFERQIASLSKEEDHFAELFSSSTIDNASKQTQNTQDLFAD